MVGKLLPAEAFPSAVESADFLRDSRLAACTSAANVGVYPNVEGVWISMCECWGASLLTYRLAPCNEDCRKTFLARACAKRAPGFQSADATG